MIEIALLAFAVSMTVYTLVSFLINRKRYEVQAIRFLYLVIILAGFLTSVLYQGPIKLLTSVAFAAFIGLAMFLLYVTVISVRTIKADLVTAGQIVVSIKADDIQEMISQDGEVLYKLQSEAYIKLKSSGKLTLIKVGRMSIRDTITFFEVIGNRAVDSDDRQYIKNSFIWEVSASLVIWMMYAVSVCVL